MTDTVDVIVVGGGFGGLTAARELAHHGRRVLLLEGRDRIGGRTWTTPFAGVEVEMGGAWVHWFQAHVWSEITRYGLEIEDDDEPERCAWISGGHLMEVSPEELGASLDAAWRSYARDARDLLPRPAELLWSDALANVDRLSQQDRLSEIDLEPEVRDLFGGLLSTGASAPNAEAGLVHGGLKGFALAAYDPALVAETNGGYRITTGTRSLVEAIANDGGVEIRLSTPAARVAQDRGGVTVATRTGETHRAQAAVIAVPLNALGAIEFDPPLSEGKRAMVDEGHAGRGAKVWLRARGEVAPFIGIAPDDHPLTFLETAQRVDGDTLLIGFGPRGDVLDPANRAALEAAVHAFLPDARIEEIGGHPWHADEYSFGTWCVFRPGQITRYLRDLQEPEERLLLAGSDLASGWVGWIDGAIESGLRAAREIERMLSST